MASSRHVAFVAAALGLLSCSIGQRPAADAPRSVTHTVTIDGLRFQPDLLTIRSGDSVVWVNKDPFPHTVTAARAGGFDSREIVPGQSWKFSPPAKGAFDYTCTFHPMMKAKLQVE